MKYEKSYREWMGLTAKTTAYLYNNYGVEEAANFWKYNIEVMKPFWEKLGIEGTSGFTDAMTALADVMKNEVRVLHNDKYSASGVVLKCGIKDAVKEYQYLNLPETFPCEIWCEPFWKRISEALGLDSKREILAEGCKYTVTQKVCLNAIRNE
ncbi:MAG: hypothetical protein WC568_12300 [Candidatus Methanoperedens sp.]